MDHVPTSQPQATSSQGDGSKGGEAIVSDSKLQVTSHNQYKTPRLLRTDLKTDPLAQFREWLDHALNPREDLAEPKVQEPEAMTVSTTAMTPDPSGQTSALLPIVSSRVVLLKQVDDTGFVFYTNYNSRKSKEISSNPYVALNFYWRETSRSVRISGLAHKVSREESVDYFKSRPRGSQLGAWASRQSEEVSEELLQERVKEEERRWEGKDVECPEHWGGWRVVPL